MNAYEHLASVYDLFMGEIPYESWAKHINVILKNFVPNCNLVLDLGCGTGNITTLLKDFGYEMIGVDISEDMLAVAKEKSKDILYLNQDMCDFELYGTVDACICVCDSVNYILEETELTQMLALVKNYLNPNGLFIFDINTEYKYQHILGDNNFSRVEEDTAYIWENFYDDEQKINEYYANIFVKNDSNNYTRYEEFHYQKAYSVEALKGFIENIGLKLLHIYDGFTFDLPQEKSERLVFVVQKGD